MATVASTATYSLATTMAEVRGARIGGSIDMPLEQITIEELSAMGVNLEETGQPRYFYISTYTVATQVVTIGFWPIPSAVYSIIVYETLRPIDVASGSSVPFPEDFYAVLREGTRYYMEKDQREFAAAAMAGRDFRNALAELRYKYATDQAQETGRYYTDVKGRARYRFPGFSGRYPI